MASNTDFKAPPSLSKCASYETWKKELKIWQRFTSLAKEKQGPAIFLTLEGRARESVLEIELDTLSGIAGVDEITKHLDKIYLKDRKLAAYEAYENFEKFKRSANMSIRDFINEFERLHCKVKEHKSEMSSDILAYRLLKSANLSTANEQLAKATVAELDYETMKTQLLKIFGDAGGDASASSSVKNEVLYESADEANETFYENRYNAQSMQPYTGRGRFQANRRGNNFQTRGFPARGGRGGYRSSVNPRRGRNPSNSKGQVTHCSICDSINHWAVNCPDAMYYSQMTNEDFEKSDEENYEVTLYQSNMITDEQVKIFVAESLNSAILDSGATSSVAGRVWLECYLGSLSVDSVNYVHYTKSSNSFKFGSGQIFHSLYRVSIPANIGTKKVNIETDIVEADIPLLLSRKAMKKASTNINFMEDKVSMFGEDLDVVVTESGHYALPLNEQSKIMKKLEEGNPKVTLSLVTVDPADKKKVAIKLHSQFSHPSARNLIKLVVGAGWGNDHELINQITKVSEECKICQEYKKPTPRPIAGLPMATEFNEVVAMDLKYINGDWILHLIDHVSRFSAAAYVRSKKPEEIIENIFQIWISVFGPPKRFLSDNGGEFNNKMFRDLCESFNIRVLTTAAEAPWSNGLCERHNAVLGDMLLKTLAENHCNKKTALCWVIHAKNSLANVHGFTPYQLAIGYTPKLPSNLFNEPPALESSESKSVLNHLNAIAAARRAFVEADSSERIKRALRHNIRPSNNTKFYPGESVYYKRADSKKWKGPGKVIGQDGQQVLIKHGGIYVRVHPCRAMHEKLSHCKPSSSSDQSQGIENEDSNSKMLCSEPKFHMDSGHSLSDYEDMYDQESPVPDDENPLPDMQLPPPQEDLEENIVNSAESVPLEDAVAPMTKLKKNMEIEFKALDSEEWKRGKIHSRAGKVGGKYENHWNLIENGVIEEMNFENFHWRPFESEESDELSDPEEHAGSEEILLCETYVSEVDQETMKAKNTEHNNWLREDVYEEVNDNGQNTISVRWVVTPKIIDGKLSTKARLVARGFEEDKSSLRTDSPTCMRETLKIVLAIAASSGWDINSIDIKAAFLQGKEIDRELYLDPPKEFKNPGKIWRLKKVVYGLSDASRVWYMRVREELSKMGCIISGFDKALFYWKRNCQTEGILVVHVDDFLWCGSDKFKNEIVLKLKNIFRISKETKGAFKYLGIDLKQFGDHLSVSQKSYSDSIKSIKIPQISDKVGNSTVDRSLHKMFRGIVGQLSWATGISRPDMAFSSCSLSTAQSSPTYRDICDANKAVRDLKSSDVVIKYPCLDLKSTNIHVYADASYGNLPNGGSQGGHIIFLVDKRGQCAPVAWCSKKIKRVVRSTLGAETLSAVDSLDSSHLINKIFSELLNLKEREIETFLHTDNKSLYDAIGTTNLVTDKRLRVDLAALREQTETESVTFRWIDSANQLADVLTKRGANKKKLLDVLNSAHLPL